MTMNFLPFLSLSLDIKASLIAQLVKNLPAMQETQFNSWIRKIPWRRDRLPTPVFGSAGKDSACNAGDQGSIPGLGRSPGDGKVYPLQYSGLENSMNSIVHGVTELGTTQQLSLPSMYRAITSSLLLGCKCPPLA